MTAGAGGAGEFAPCKSWAPFCGSVYVDAALLSVTKRSTGKVSGSAVGHVTVGNSLSLSGSWFPLRFRDGVGWTR